MRVQRIAIFGCAGSGKSTLAKQLQKVTQLPLYHLDQIYWLPGWIRRDFEEFKNLHNALCDKEQWIIDGSSMQTIEYRLERADLIIFLDIPRWLCLYRVFTRFFWHHGTVRQDSPPGCPERLSLEFLRWIWEYPTRNVPRAYTLLEKLAQTSDKQIYVLRSKEDIKRLLNDLKDKSAE